MNARRTDCEQNVICCNACTCKQKTDSACTQQRAPSVPRRVTKDGSAIVLQELNSYTCETSLNGHVNTFRLGIITLTPCNTSKRTAIFSKEVLLGCINLPIMYEHCMQLGSTAQSVGILSAGLRVAVNSVCYYYYTFNVQGRQLRP